MSMVVIAERQRGTKGRSIEASLIPRAKNYLRKRGESKAVQTSP